MQTILFVCTGNTCRSAMAEALFKHILASRKSELKDIEILSAGIYAWEGDKVSPGAVEALKEMGIDAMDHSSTLLTPKLVAGADLVLTMTLNHKEAVLHMCPEAEDKVYTLKEYILGDGDERPHGRQTDTSDTSPGAIDYDIKDPYGQSADVYRESAREIEEYLQKLVDRFSAL